MSRIKDLDISRCINIDKATKVVLDDEDLNIDLDLNSSSYPCYKYPAKKQVDDNGNVKYKVYKNQDPGRIAKFI